MNVNSNQYDRRTLNRRSALASRLRYGQPAARSADYAKDIPFPRGLEPVPDISVTSPRDGPLPKADIVAMMDTSAETQAMADVLTPGVEPTKWHPYARNFERLLPQIGPDGPARESRCLGEYCFTTINGLRVLVYHTELHMHEDAKKMPDGSYSLPIRSMLTQMIQDASPKVFLTTGTSGGVYCSMSLGDVAVSRAARFYCMKDFADAPFNNQTFKSGWTVPSKYFPQAQQLMRKYAGHLTGRSSPRGSPPNAKCGCSPLTYPTNIYLDGTEGIPEFHPILTTDFFEFGTSTNNLDKLGMAVEMDDACLGLACSDVSSPPRWACVRNLSDPTINGSLSESEQNSCAEYYYTKFGYWTTVMSALTTWGIISGM